MFDKEISELEKKIDELSPKLESLEKQMREKVKELHFYQNKKYRLELGFDKEYTNKYNDLPERLKGLPDRYIDKHFFRQHWGTEIRYIEK